MNSVLAMQNHPFGPMAQFALFLMSTASMFMVCLAASGVSWRVFIELILIKLVS
jgi:hypothetical protein